MKRTGDELDRAVEAAQRGDRHALGDVLDSVRPVILRYCRARIGVTDRRSLSADDVAQEVCLAIVTALPRYQRQGKPFLAFAYGIAAHKVADAFRGAARDRADPYDEVTEARSNIGDPERAALDGEANERVELLLGTLSERQREILILRVVVGLSAEETAAAVGGTAGAVRVAQHRALAALRNELTDERGMVRFAG